MPFIRYMRDKRGYETTYVVHSYRGAQGAGRTRVLYLFRSPPNVTVGRHALDDEARVALEHTHPDLSFDWQSLDRDAVTARPESAQKPWRDERSGRPPQQPAKVMVVEDQSVLGRTLGAAEASRLRSRYAELLQRISRRSRSPEERDQLTTQAQRLNPDDWTDETAVRANAGGVESEWDALNSALPQRRRGRRGGRRREGRPAPGSPPSAIMDSGEIDEAAEDAHVADAHRDAGDPGDHDSL